MLRVSKKGILAIEACDNLLSRLSVKLGLVPQYEIAVLLSNVKGGVDNSHVPNYVYRWTKSKVKETVSSYLPNGKNKYLFFRKYRFPFQRLGMEKGFSKYFAKLLPFLAVVLENVLPTQANEFGFCVVKGRDVFPWLKGTRDNPELNLEYLRQNYKTDL